MATPYTGQLNSNEIYNLFNMIISQEVFPINVATPELADKLRVDGTLYGDTKLYTSIDVTGSYDWLNDAEAENLLKLNRNKNIKTQSITLNKFRQTNTTVDYYLSKRAFMGEGTFADFTGTLLSVLSSNKAIYDNGLVNAFVGTQVSTAPKANITVDLSSIGTPTTISDQESYNRLRGQKIAAAISKMGRELKDNSRDFNELEYMRSVNPDDLIFVWNGDRHDDITYIDLPTIFHKDGLYGKAENVELTGRFFGTVNQAATKGNGTTIRSLIEQDIKTGDDTTHYFPGDLIKATDTAPAKTSYTQTYDVICKVFPKKAIPFMSAFQVDTVFVNPRSLTENHYTTWGHNDLERLKEFPFVTINITEPAPTPPGD